MKQRARPWTHDDDELLRSLAARGFSEGQIGEQLSRNKSSVRSRAAIIKVAIARDANGRAKLSWPTTRRGSK